MTVTNFTNVRIMIGKISARYDPSTLYIIISIRGLKVTDIRHDNYISLSMHNYSFLLSCILFNDAVTNSDYTASTDLILMYNE